VPASGRKDASGIAEISPVYRLTKDLHWTPLARTASMTASTFFRRERTLALRVTDSFHGVFLSSRYEIGRYDASR
jgi:hypothetical protein